MYDSRLDLSWMPFFHNIQCHRRGPQTYMSQPQIGLHDLIDFILQLRQNYKIVTAKENRWHHFTKTGRTKLHVIIPDMRILREAPESSWAWSWTHLTAGAVRSEHNFDSNRSVVKVDEQRVVGEETCIGRGGFVCMWHRPWINQSHKPVQNINRSSDHELLGRALRFCCTLSNQGLTPVVWTEFNSNWIDELTANMCNPLNR